jgi:hypothetical protein
MYINNQKSKRYSLLYISSILFILKKNHIKQHSPTTIKKINIFPFLDKYNIYNQSWNFKKTIIVRKRTYHPKFNYMYVWANSISLAYFIRSQLSRGLSAASILASLKKTLPHMVSGICIQLTGRMTGASRASKKKYMFGSCSFSSIRSNLEYHYLTTQSRFGMSSIKVWINFK